MDRVNALLSFLYTLLAGDCAAALEAVELRCVCRVYASGQAGQKLAGVGFNGRIEARWQTGWR